MFRLLIWPCEISDFRGEIRVSEKSALLGFYATSSGSLLTCFWEVCFSILACYPDLRIYMFFKTVVMRNELRMIIFF